MTNQNDPSSTRDRPACSDIQQLFSGPHARIHEKMGVMRELQASLAGGAVTPQAVELAAGILKFFATTVRGHHVEEEQELWPLLRRAAPGSEEADTFKSIGARLKQEHEQLEALWRRIEPGLERIARGRHSDLDPSLLAALADMYDQHAAFEDAVVIPMAEHLLDPNDQTRLQMSIALRRMPAAMRGYI